MKRPMSNSLITVLLALLLMPPAGKAEEIFSLTDLALDSLLQIPISTASKYDQKQTEAPAFVSIITRSEIQDFGYVTLGEVLQAQTGFYIGDDREYVDVGSRGFGRPGYYNNKLLLLVDGHTVNEGFTGGTRFGTALGIDLDMVERIELVRGPGSSLYGARAMLAVINVVTRKGRDIDQTTVHAEAGSNGYKSTSLHLGTVLGSDSDLAISAKWAESDGEDIYFPELDSPILNFGIAENLDWEENIQVQSSYRKGNLLVHGFAAQRKKGVPTAPYTSRFNDPNAAMQDQSGFLELQYTRSLGTTVELTGRAYSDVYKNDRFYPFAGGNSANNLAGTSTTSNIVSRSVGGEFRLRWDPTFSQRLVTGVELVRYYQITQDLVQDEAVLLSMDKPYSILSAFVHDELQLTPDLALTVGLRHDHYSTRGSATTPRIALVYHAGRASTVKLLVGEAFRAPNSLELYLDTDIGTALGNPELDAERIRSFELILEQRLGSVALTVSAFYNQMWDLIDLVQIQWQDSTQTYGSFLFQQQNVAEARSGGFECELRAVLPGQFFTRLGYTYQDAIDSKTSERLVNAPRHMLRLNASKSVAQWFRVGLGLRGESNRRTLYGTSSEAAMIMDATLSSPDRFEHWDLRLSIKNLLDTRYTTPGATHHIQSSIPQHGRMITLRAGYSW